jgi:PBP1b-binding outer membrane lipoprotein LpoB
MPEKMNSTKLFTLLGIFMLMLVSGCKSNTASKEFDELALFTTTEVFDSASLSYKLIPSVERLISIPKNESIEKKISTLIDSVSKNSFHNLKIEVLSINVTPEGKKSLLVNLKENPGFIMPDSLGNYRNWYDFFQGSMRGEQTTIILIESLLQREFAGVWIDEVRFYYQNEEMGEWDHVFLSGVISR